MELAYIRDKGFFGEFFYHPLTHQGVVIPESGCKVKPVVIGMSKDYNPLEEPGVSRIDVEPVAFEKLLKAASDMDKKAVNKVLLEYFQFCRDLPNNK